NLPRYAAQRRPPARVAAALAADLASAVAYLHGRGIVHQEVRPENVLVDTTGRPRLMVAVTSRLRHPDSTPGWDERSSPATDVFGLGLLLDGLLNGRPQPQGGGAATRP